MSKLVLPVCLCAVDVLAVKDRDGKLLSDAIMQFSTEVFQKLSTKDQHVVFSPYSVYSSFLMLYLASVGDSKKLLARVLRFKRLNRPDPAYISNHYLHELPSTQAKPYKLLSFDRVFLNVERVNKNTFGEKFEEIATVLKKENEREEEINDWIQKDSQGVIKKIVENGLITKKDIFVIVNVGYFMGTWTHSFDLEPHKTPFTLPDGTVRQIQFMTAKHKHLKSMTDKELEVHVINLPFDGDTLSMIIILPMKNTVKKNSPPIKNVVKKLTHKKLKSLVSALQQQKTKLTDLSIPKFQTEATHELNKPITEALGDKKLFTHNLRLPIYLGNITMRISRIVHKASIDVFGKGAEAGAGGAGLGQRMKPVKPAATFRLDHTFIYLVFDHTKNIFRFMGIFSHPK